MNKRIELRAILQRDGRVLLVDDGRGTWDLPGGSLDDDADDIDAAMDTLLRATGVVTANPAEAFLGTSYHRDGETQVVLNLYAPAEWLGEPRPGLGGRARWVMPEEVADLDVALPSREALLVTFGLRAPKEVEMPENLLKPSSRHEAGLDVLRTLSGNADPAAAFEALARRQPEIAADVVDFALGEVWATPALDRKTRSLQVVAMLSALGGRTGPLRSHINGALNHGASPGEVVETLRMVAVYAGFPAALEAWPIMEQVFEARGIARPRKESP
jgi:4-carboxymuconolactone decarboxylase